MKGLALHCQPDQLKGLAEQLEQAKKRHTSLTIIPIDHSKQYLHIPGYDGSCPKQVHTNKRIAG